MMMIDWRSNEKLKILNGTFLSTIYPEIPYVSYIVYHGLLTFFFSVSLCLSLKSRKHCLFIRIISFKSRRKKGTGMTIDNSPDSSSDEDVSTKEDTTIRRKQVTSSSKEEEDGFDSDASNEEHKSKTVRFLLSTSNYFNLFLSLTHTHILNSGSYS